MTLLELTAVELRQKVESALASNPALELVDVRRCPSCRRPLPGSAPCPFCRRSHQLSADQPIVFVSPREDFFTGSKNVHNNQGEEYIEDSTEMASSVEDLPQYVLRQIAPELEPANRPIAAHILTSLDEDGLLTIPLLEIARYHHVPLARVQAVLRLIQRAEPIGVASPTPQDALLVQLEILTESRPVPPLASQAIEKGMDLLSRRRYPELGRLLGVSTSQAQEIARFIIENLNPFPGRAHWGDLVSGRGGTGASGIGGSDTRPYTVPDVIISRLGESEDTALVVEVSLPLGGLLRVNPLFREALQQAPSEKAEHWQADLDQASLLVKCIQQRNHTMVRLMHRLSILQRDFIMRGEAYLQPLTRATLAQELEVHESTISRAVSSKSIQLPNGHIVPLSMFFDRSLHIRTALKKIVAQEADPLSDTEIGVILARQGYSVARRTVAKYRAMEGILPAHLRRPVFAQAL
jgi:RNA polymerase sigma-54 factor